MTDKQGDMPEIEHTGDELAQKRLENLVGNYKERTDCPNCSTVVTKAYLSTLQRKADMAEMLCGALEYYANADYCSVRTVLGAGEEGDTIDDDAGKIARAAIQQFREGKDE